MKSTKDSASNSIERKDRSDKDLKLRLSLLYKLSAGHDQFIEVDEKCVGLLLREKLALSKRLLEGFVSELQVLFKRR